MWFKRKNEIRLADHLLGWGEPFPTRPSRELSGVLDVLGADGYDFSKHCQKHESGTRK